MINQADLDRVGCSSLALLQVYCTSIKVRLYVKNILHSRFLVLQTFKEST